MHLVLRPFLVTLYLSHCHKVALIFTALIPCFSATLYLPRHSAYQQPRTMDRNHELKQAFPLLVNLFECFSMKSYHKTFSPCANINSRWEYALRHCPSCISVAITKYLDENNLEEKRFILSHNSVLHSVTTWKSQRRSLKQLLTLYLQWAESSYIN